MNVRVGMSCCSTCKHDGVVYAEKLGERGCEYRLRGRHGGDGGLGEKDGEVDGMIWDGRRVYFIVAGSSGGHSS